MTSALQSSLHDTLVECGFELLENGIIYRGTADTDVAPGRRRNAFISFPEDDENPSVMSIFAEDASQNPDALDLVRQPDDGYTIVKVNEMFGFQKYFDPAVITGNTGILTSEAIAVAQYADQVNYALTQLQQEKETILARLQHWVDSDNWDLITSGEVSTKDFLADAERILTIIPAEGLWATIIDTANRASMFAWASSTTGATLSDQPWSHIAEWLSHYGANKGWELSE